MHFARLANTLLDTKKAQETITFLNVLLTTLPNFATENTADPAAARTSITRPCRGVSVRTLCREEWKTERRREREESAEGAVTGD